RRHRLRPRSHGGAARRRGCDPRRDRLPEDAARPGPADRRADAGHREAAARAAHPPEEPDAVVRVVAALLAVVAFSAFAFQQDVRLKELPAEARDTLALIKQNGPFPYARDGVVFGNREALLPKKQRGYYREYTVKTPGARDRGARRIVAGRGGEL